MDHSARQRQQAIHHGVVARGQRLQSAPLRSGPLSLPSELEGSLHPPSVEVRVVAQQVRLGGASLRVPGQGRVRPRQPAGGFLPASDVADLIQLDAGDPLHEEPEAAAASSTAEPW